MNPEADVSEIYTANGSIESEQDLELGHTNESVEDGSVISLRSSQSRATSEDPCVYVYDDTDTSSFDSMVCESSPQSQTSSESETEGEEEDLSGQANLTIRLDTSQERRTVLLADGNSSQAETSAPNVDELSSENADQIGSESPLPTDLNLPAVLPVPRRGFRGVLVQALPERPLQFLVVPCCPARLCEDCNPRIYRRIVLCVILQEISRLTVSIVGQVCTICLNELVVGQGSRIFPCGHTFHDYCILLWLVTSFTCPLCRLNVRDQFSNEIQGAVHRHRSVMDLAPVSPGQERLRPASSPAPSNVRSPFLNPAVPTLSVFETLSANSIGMSVSACLTIHRSASASIGVEPQIVNVRLPLIQVQVRQLCAAQSLAELVERQRIAANSPRQALESYLLPIRSFEFHIERCGAVCRFDIEYPDLCDELILPLGQELGTEVSYVQLKRQQYIVQNYATSPLPQENREGSRMVEYLVEYHAPAGVIVPLSGVSREVRDPSQSGSGLYSGQPDACAASERAFQGYLGEGDRVSSQLRFRRVYGTFEYFQPQVQPMFSDHLDRIMKVIFQRLSKISCWEVNSRDGTGGTETRTVKIVWIDDED